MESIKDCTYIVKLVIKFNTNSQQKQQKHPAEIDNDDDVTTDVELTGVQVSKL